MTKTQAQRLLDVATALRTASPAKKKGFNMGDWCCPRTGAPLCAIGFYADSGLSTRFSIVRGYLSRRYHLSGPEPFVGGNGDRKYFGVGDDWRALFGTAGCGGAETALQAAKYIENYLDEKGWEIAA